MVYDMGIYNIVPLMYVNMDKQSAVDYSICF